MALFGLFVNECREFRENIDRLCTDASFSPNNANRVSACLIIQCAQKLILIARGLKIQFIAKNLKTFRR